MSVREISKKGIHEHEAEALLFVHPDDFTADELEALEERYPGIEKTARAYIAHSGFKAGMVAVKAFGDDEQRVLFACLADQGTVPGYAEVKAVFAKIIESQEKTGIKHVASGPIGIYAKRIHANALADVMRVAIRDSDLAVDYHYESPV